MSSGGNVRVVCRFRPQNRVERENNGRVVVEVNDGKEIKIDGEQKHTFTFDSVYEPTSTQAWVFEDAALPTIQDLFKGYNGTIFVYGQTGSGKTHTMMGPDGGKGIELEDMKGIVPRMIDTIFDICGTAPEELEFLVKCAYIEIYMEKIRDLLDETKDNLRVREDKVKGVWVEGCTEVYVSEPNDVMNVLKTGSQNRAIAATKMNAESSRSHSVFILTVVQKNSLTGSTMNGKLYFVDLAGSEKVGKTGASGQTLEEAKTINKSLSALGNVINALTDEKVKHVPYRDSKLTRILQESLGGNSRTTLIINCSPSSYNELETLSTIRFGNRAKNIKNRARVNKEQSAAELKKALDKAGKEIRRLRVYIAGLEEELHVLRGDTPTIRPSGKLPASSSVPNLLSATKGNGSDKDTSPGTLAPQQTVASPSTNTTTTTHDASSLPNVEAIQAQVMHLDAKVAQLAEEKAALEADADRVRDEMQEHEVELSERAILLQELHERLQRAQYLENEMEQKNAGLVREIAQMELAQEKSEATRQEQFLLVESLQEQNLQFQQHIESLEQKIQRLQFEKEEDEDAILKRARMREERQKEMASSLEASVGADAASAIIDSSPSKSNDDEVQQLRIELEKLRKEKVPILPAGSSQPHDSYAYEAELSRLRSENEAVKNELQALQQSSIASQVDDFFAEQETEDQLSDVSSKYQALQLESRRRAAEFEQLKHALMRDLQNRCEKVIDLEMLLDEARAQYEELLAKSNNQAVLKKNRFLEKNLTLLKNAHHQLVNQSNELRLQNQITTKRLAIREEKLVSVEQDLENHTKINTELAQQAMGFQTEIASLKEELATLKRQLATRHSSPKFSRMAKPIRGGGTQSSKQKSGGFWSSFSRSSSNVAASSQQQKK